MAQTKIKLIADGVIDENHLKVGHTITTDNIGEGTNLYYTDARVGSYLSTNSYATEGYVTTAVANLVDAAPSTLDTLNELAAALGDDPNFATTVTNSIATKLPLAGGTLTGDLIVNAKIGIGTSSPNGKAHIQNSALSGFVARTGATLTLENNGYTELYLTSPSTAGGQIRFGDENSNFAGAISYEHAGDYFIHYTAGAERMRITSDGNVGIGTTDAKSALEVRGTFGAPATSGFASGFISRFSQTLGAGCLDIGFGDPYSWLQSRASNNYATNYSLALNPNGGNVGIGTSSPASKVDINNGAANSLLTLTTASFDGTYRAGINFQVNTFASTPSGQIALVGDNNYSGNMIFSTAFGGTTNSPVERMRITSAGNVGIGTSNPAYKLDVVGAGRFSSTLLIADNTAVNFGLTSQIYHNSSNAATHFTGTGGTDTVVIKDSGNMGVGTTSPTAKLDVNSGATNTVAAFRSTDSGAYIGMADPSTTLDAGYPTLSIGAIGNDLVLSTSNAERMRITSTGNVGVGMTPFVNSLNTGNIDLANGGGIWGWTKGTYVTGNTYFNSNWRYKEVGYGTILHVNGNDGDFRFYTMPYSGTAGAPGTPSERMRITSAGDVGIGTSSPSSKLDVAGVTTVQRLTAADGGVNIINIGQNTTAGGYSVVRMLGASNRTSWEIGQNAQILNALSFTPSTASGGSTFTSPTVAFPNTGGITFNGDTAAANALDDYEEGDWTPSIAFNYGTTGITYSTQLGHYTKIGRQVTVTGYCALTNKGSSTGIALITGLPFTIGNNDRNYSAPSLNLDKITFANQHQGYGIIGSTSILLTETTEAGVSGALDAINFANNSNFIISFTYFI